MDDKLNAYKEIAAGIPLELRQEIADTPLNKNISELLAMARMPSFVNKLREEEPALWEDVKQGKITFREADITRRLKKMAPELYEEVKQGKKSLQDANDELFKKANSMFGGDILSSVFGGSGGRRRCNLGPKSMRIVYLVQDILEQYPNMKLTLRQIYYRLVASQEIKNSRSSYNRLSGILAQAREEGLIDPEAIEDRMRRLDGLVDTWETPTEYQDAIKKWTFELGENYLIDLWVRQNKYIEIWTEKDALANILSQAASPYRIPIAVCRGYNSLTFLHETVKRFSNNVKEREPIILYFGDFDPSGEDMVRDIRERLDDYFELWGDMEALPEIRKAALLREDIDEYNLPPDFAKKTDTRARDFIRKHGDISVELDALPPDELIKRVEESVTNLIKDSQAWDESKEREKQERKKVMASLEKVWSKNA